MRTCPTCQRSYLDTQNTCQADGTPLPPPAYQQAGQYQQAPPPGMNPMMPPSGYPPPGYPPPQPGGWQGYPPPAYPPGTEMYAPCPTCRRPDAEKVKFTWWGGLIGPRLFSHVKCRGCGTTYNGKSGKSNTTAITLYLVIPFVIALVIVVIFVLGK
ncbi:MAG TPA: hypothetical protein VF791_09985 [Pyrinomonadaceae bacterium]